MEELLVNIDYVLHINIKKGLVVGFHCTEVSRVIKASDVFFIAWSVVFSLNLKILVFLAAKGGFVRRNSSPPSPQAT